MSVPTNETLIDYLDNQLDAEAARQVESSLQADVATRESYNDLQFAVALIREAGLQQQVADARKEFQSGAVVKPMQSTERTAIVRPMFSKIIRVAAMVIILAGAAAIYQYSATTSTGVYNDYYNSYELNTNRGLNNSGKLETAYRNKNWAAVNSLYEAMPDKGQKASFLAGMASLEQKQFETAGNRFKVVLSVNEGAKETLYQEEAEYYLALSYLGAGKGKEGAEILKGIRENKDHLFHEQALKIPSLDLRVLKIKGNK
jgi:hypothetical protein